MSVDRIHIVEHRKMHIAHKFAIRHPAEYTSQFVGNFVEVNGVKAIPEVLLAISILATRLPGMPYCLNTSLILDV